ncbi:Callose synthase 12 [Hibiscus syriacus]|uniref:1,3-beta-glucan synthase n=1 Tax=Hibiscus syriacus TaxID=106335 RepID=A0A6A3B655_HIBSY|nr:Callose synthase 12 [Hibiscus syriacus]
MFNHPGGGGGSTRYFKRNSSIDICVHADLLLQFGFGDDLKALTPAIPRRCQCLLLSATSSPDVDQLKRMILHNPFVLTLSEAEDVKDEVIPKSVQQLRISCNTSDKLLYVLALMKLELVLKKVSILPTQLILFGIRSAILNAELPQNSRLHVLEDVTRSVTRVAVRESRTHLLKHDKVVTSEQGPSRSPSSTNQVVTRVRRKVTEEAEILSRVYLPRYPKGASKDKKGEGKGQPLLYTFGTDFKEADGCTFGTPRPRAVPLSSTSYGPNLLRTRSKLMWMDLSCKLRGSGGPRPPPRDCGISMDIFFSILSLQTKSLPNKVKRSKKGTASHDKWRNYDDFNEYFRSKKCFQNLKWPLDFSDFTNGRKIRFVEQRTFWNVFKSFDRLWLMLFLFLHVGVILAWEGKKLPWQALDNKDVKVRVLTLFITWSGMRCLHALLEAVMEFGRVSRETSGLGLRMVLKILVAAAWTYAFLTCYTRIWSQKNYSNHWSGEANQRVTLFRLAFLYALPELVKLVFFFLPSITLNCKVLYPISWWFHGDCFIGRGMKEGVVDSIKYILFWVVVLGTQFTFSYFFQIKPMISTTKQLLDSRITEYEWDWKTIFSVGNKFIIGLLWFPVLLIYLADTQIWYSIYSPIVGAAMGLMQQLGEIRNIEQLRYRFQFFAGAIQSNLMPQEETNISCGRGKFREAIHLLKLRCGLRQPFKMVESNQVKANKFAFIWNEIITTFREEDIISDDEVELLQLPPNSWGIKVIRWPCSLLGNELLRALDMAMGFIDRPDKWLWHKICNNEYRRCAVIETYDSIKYLMLRILIKNNTEEHSILEALFREIDHSIEIGKFTMTFRMASLLQVNSKLIKLLELLLKPNKNVKKIAYGMQELYEYVHYLYRVKRTASPMAESLFENAVDLPDPGNKNFYMQVKRLHTILTSKDPMQTSPGSDTCTHRQGNDVLSTSSPAPSFLDSSSDTDISVTEEEGIPSARFLCKGHEYGNKEKEYYSVLLKYDRQLQREVEIYRIKLPGPMKLGEGKPENQNHGFVFTRGDAVQTIDMNQDNYFEEALKIRNLLEEFKYHHGINRPTILGVREHIFTGSVSSVAWFMSAQETSFVTLFQCLFANLLRIRMHYGHPDVFDRLWFMTRGGFSKASKAINISEDIFAGFNCTLRGGSVTHHEYIQVGKGRDLGLNQISTFEAKISCGSGEQILSRDVYSGVENFVLGNDNNSKKALSAVINQELVIQFGFFSTLPAILESSIETGFLEAIWEFLVMQLQLSTVFYTFSMGTRAHFFGLTILHGGAKYRQTGRNFVVQHTSFVENYRRYSRSHFIKAIEFGFILIVYAVYTPSAKITFFYIDMAVTCWFLVFSWICSLPIQSFRFRLAKYCGRFRRFHEMDLVPWWCICKGRTELGKLVVRGEAPFTHNQPLGKVTGNCFKPLFLLFQYGIVYHMGISGQSKSVFVYLLSWIFIFVAVGIYLTMSYVRNKYGAKEHTYVRLAESLVMTLGILVIIALREFTAFKYVDIFTSLLALIPTGWGLISIA